MNKQFKLFITCFTMCMILPFMVGCSDDDDNGNGIEPDEKEKQFSAIVSQYVNNTVIVTYKSLADETITLYNALVELKDNKTNENVKAAADSWILARDYWELSEAFLFGPADHFSIDPHIDTWPLAKDELTRALNNTDYIQSMNQEDGDIWAGSNMEYGLLGFHGIEYILFEEGKTKDVSKISDNELIYAVAVAGDLRNQCFRLEAAWAGIDNVSSEKRSKLQQIGSDLTYSSTNHSYGYCMLNPGQTKFCESVTDACELIVEGSIDIADEVGTLKIGSPYHGEDVNYIESPYSYNSKVDFIGNIKSIQNAYLGGANANSRGASLSDYIKSIDADLDNEMKEAMAEAIAKIEAIPFPFALNYAAPEAGEAIEACNDLVDVLEDIQKALRK